MSHVVPLVRRHSCLSTSFFICDSVCVCVSKKFFVCFFVGFCILRVVPSKRKSKIIYVRVE